MTSKSDEPRQVPIAVDSIIAIVLDKLPKEQQVMFLSRLADKAHSTDRLYMLDIMQKVLFDLNRRAYVTDAAFERLRFEIAGATNLLFAMNEHGELFSRGEHPTQIEEPKSSDREEDAESNLEEQPIMQPDAIP